MEPEILRPILYRCAGATLIFKTSGIYERISILVKQAGLEPVIWNSHNPNTSIHRIGILELFTEGHCSKCHSFLNFPHGTFSPIQYGCISCTKKGELINILELPFISIPITNWYPKYKRECVEFLNNNIHFSKTSYY